MTASWLLVFADPAQQADGLAGIGAGAERDDTATDPPADFENAAGGQQKAAAAGGNDAGFGEGFGLGHGWLLDSRIVKTQANYSTERGMRQQKNTRTVNLVRGD
jgi:hypothetical protein